MAGPEIGARGPARAPVWDQLLPMHDAGTQVLPVHPPSSAAMSRLGALLSRAFLKDPLMVRVQPDPSRRSAGMPAVFSACLRHSALWGGVLAVSGEVGAVGWVPLSHLEVDWRAILAARYYTVPFRFGLGATQRLVSHGDYCDQMVRAQCLGDAAYVYVVGVEPSHSGRGLGTRLLEAALSQAAARYDSCLLRTEQPRNLPLYEKLGFHCVVHRVVPCSGVPTWVFRRSLKDLRTST